jgi:multisubunit Na+/H+ antiporter MnhB subunit
MIPGELTILDFVLAPALLVLAAVAVNVRDLFTSIVMFIIFSLIMAVIWARLDAVDVALAEAAIGAAITGALLFNAYGEMAEEPGEAPGETAGEALAGRRVIAGILVLPIVVGLAYAVIAAPPELDLLRPRVAAELDAAGIEHDVSAVLLNVRAYDTLLELSVLLLAVVGAWSLQLRTGVPEPPPLGRVLSAAERILVPTVFLLGCYLLWRGSHAPGGAFAGGTVIAGALVLLHLGSRERWPGNDARLTNAGLAAGVLVFAAVGLASTSIGLPFLTYRGAWAAKAILVIEVAATLGITLALLALFSGRPRFRQPDP